MNSTAYGFVEIKQILKSVHGPEAINRHPWTKSLSVSHFLSQHPEFVSSSQGEILIRTLFEVMLRLIPSQHPKVGKRNYTKWGQLGIVAAKYFLPFFMSGPDELTLEEAWLQIDKGIDLLQDNAIDRHPDQKGEKPATGFAKLQASPPLSTLSDWHKRGLEDLLTEFIKLERELSRKNSEKSPLLNGDTNFDSNAKKKFRLNKRIILGSIVAVTMTIAFGAVKAIAINRLLRDMVVSVNAIQLPKKGEEINDQQISQLGEKVVELNYLATELEGQVRPFIWLTPYFTWIPIYGGDIANLNELLDYGTNLSSAGALAFQGLEPALRSYFSSNGSLSPSEVIHLLTMGKSDLELSQVFLARAFQTRSEVTTQELSEKSRRLIEKMDPYLSSMQDGLMLALQVPRLAGYSEEGPKSYLVLLQNEDELRATGGFITGVGVVTIDDGEILSFSFRNSGEIDDLSLTYNSLPWQMGEFMDGGLWLMRDANWSPDFPEVAKYAERLFAYSTTQTVDGVVALDQQAIQILLDATGPIQIDGQIVFSEGLIPFMRSQKDTLSDELGSSHRKDFLPLIAEAIIAKIQENPNFSSIQELVEASINALNEKHLIVQVDNKPVTELFERRGWNGAIAQGTGDYLLVVDSNLGFNKTNAAVEREIVYSVDLRDLNNPVAELEIIHINTVAKSVECTPIEWRQNVDPDYQTIIDQCYWNYLRVYPQLGTKLIRATPHAIPGEWMLLGNPIPARVDELGVLDGGYGFGTMMVVPTGSSLSTSFSFQLPERVVSVNPDDNSATYHLRVQKQAGTDGQLFTVRISPPFSSSSGVESSLPGQWFDSAWEIVTKLKTDLDITVTFFTDDYE